MAKYADYYISQVRYNSTHAHIVEVGGYPDNNGSLGQFRTWTKDQVVSLIESGFSFMTITRKSQEDGWVTGAKVGVIRVVGFYGVNKYLRTDENQIAVDNLGNLPEY